MRSPSGLLEPDAVKVARPVLRGPRCLRRLGATRHKKEHSGAGSLDVDHLVPLAEAWRSGASAWKDEEREQYANDMADPRVLAAVTATEKRLKGDRDPARWEPSDDSADCRYIAEWAAVKGRWKLAVDSGELAALENMVAECPTEEITYELAL